MTRAILRVRQKQTRGRIHVRLEWACIALVVGAAFLVRLWGMTHMHFWDENIYLLNAEYFFSGSAGYTEVDSRPPLLSILFALVYHLWHSDYAAECVTALLNALGPAFLFLAGRRVVSTAAAAIAALLLAFSPFFVGACPDGAGNYVSNCNGHSLLSDCPALTLILLAFWLLVRALEQQTVVRFALAGLGLALAVLMRFGSLSSIGILSLLVLAASRPVRAALACAAGFALGIAPYLIWSRIQYGDFLETFRQGWWNLGGPSEPFDYYLRNLPELLSWLVVAGLALWIALRIFDLRRKPAPTPKAANDEPEGRTHRLRWEGFLCFWAAAILLFFSSLSHKETRYDIPIAPPLLLLAGVGLSETVLRARGRSRAVLAAALAVAMLATFWPIRHRFDGPFFDPSESDEMIVAGFLRQNLSASTLLYANQNYPDFAYYSGMKVEPLPESGAELYDSLQHLKSGAILIAYKQNDLDDTTPVEPPLKLLDANPRLARYREFPLIVLYKSIDSRR